MAEYQVWLFFVQVWDIAETILASIALLLLLLIVISLPLGNLLNHPNHGQILHPNLCMVEMLV